MTARFTPTPTAPVLAAALIVRQSKTSIAPSWLAGLCDDQPVVLAAKLVPVHAVDFYPKERPRA